MDDQLVEALDAVADLDRDDLSDEELAELLTAVGHALFVMDERLDLMGNELLQRYGSTAESAG
jgi:hypothetical protein